MRFLFLLVFISATLFAPSPRDGSDNSDGSGGVRPVRRGLRKKTALPVKATSYDFDDSDSSGRVRPRRKRSPVYNSSSTSATSEGLRKSPKMRQQKSMDWVEGIVSDSDSDSSGASSRSSSRSARSRSYSSLSSGSSSPVSLLDRKARKRSMRIKAARARVGLKVPLNPIDISDSSSSSSGGSSSETDSFGSFVTARSRVGSSVDTDDYETATSEVDSFPVLDSLHALYATPSVPQNKKLLRGVRQKKRVAQPLPFSMPKYVGEAFVPPSLGVVTQSGGDENSFVIPSRGKVAQARPVRHRRHAFTEARAKNAPVDHVKVQTQQPFVLAPDADSFVIPRREEVDSLISNARSTLPRGDAGRNFFVVPPSDAMGGHN